MKTQTLGLNPNILKSGRNEENVVCPLFQYSKKNTKPGKKTYHLNPFKRTTEVYNIHSVNHHHYPFLGLPHPKTGTAQCNLEFPSSSACPLVSVLTRRTCLFQLPWVSAAGLTDVCAMASLLHLVEVLQGPSRLQHVPQLNPFERITPLHMNTTGFI